MVRGLFSRSVWKWNSIRQSRMLVNWAQRYQFRDEHISQFPFVSVAAAGGILVSLAVLALSPEPDRTEERIANSRRRQSLCEIRHEALKAEREVLPKPFSTSEKPYELEFYRDLGENVRLFRFKMPSADAEFYLPIVSTLRAAATVNGSHFTRLYTPVSPNFTKGHFDIVIRHQGGIMSRMFWAMQPGDTMRFRRTPTVECYAAGRFRHVVLIAGGVGATPILQILREIVNNPIDKTPVTLIAASRNEHDMVLHEEFSRLASKHKDQLSYVPILSRPSGEEWGGSSGHIDRDFLKKTLPRERRGVHVFVCGSDRMVGNLVGVGNDLLGQWSSGRACQPGRFSHWQGTDRGVLSDLGFPTSCVTAF